MDRIDEIRKRLSETSPYPWQKSYFVDSHRYRHQSEEWKKDARERESKVVRAFGTVGSPSCNPVGVIDTNPWDKEFIMNAPADIEYLLQEIKKMQEEHSGVVDNLKKQIRTLVKRKYYRAGYLAKKKR